MANKIQPIAKRETVDYGDCDVKNFWMLRSESSRSGHKDRIKQLLQNVHSGYICVYSERIEDMDIVKLLFDLSEKVRIYVLVNEYTSAMDNLKGKALIRYSGINNIGSFVLINPNSNVTKGLFFSGQLTEGSLLLEHISFIITPDESKELFRHFCHQFWECAKTEIIEKEPVEVKAKPFDIYYETDRFDSKDYVWGTLFEFVENDSRKKLAGKRIVYYGNEKQLPTAIQAESMQVIGDNTMKELLTRDIFEAQKPDFKDDGISVQINYTWQNVPFYLPDNSKEHNLYNQWKSEKDIINQKVSLLISALFELENRENTVSKKITRFFLGKKQKFEELKSQISEIQSVDFSNVTKENRDEYMRQINEISESIIKHGFEIDVENRKAKVNEEIDALQKQIDDKQQELSKKNAELDSKKQELENSESEYEKIFVSKLESEIKDVEKSIQHLENQKKSKQKEIVKIESEGSGSGSSLDAFDSGKNRKRKNDDNGKPFEIQNLPQLPRVGKLYLYNGNAYLAIENWEDYEIGKTEADRFSAKLCAIK